MESCPPENTTRAAGFSRIGVSPAFICNGGDVFHQGACRPQAAFGISKITGEDDFHILTHLGLAALCDQLPATEERIPNATLIRDLRVWTETVEFMVVGAEAFCNIGHHLHTTLAYARPKRRRRN